MTEDSVGRPPIEQWWCINGEAIMDALKRVHAGADPELEYLLLYAHSDRTDYGDSE